MPIEIERRFLVSDQIAVLDHTDPNTITYLRQGYLGRVDGMQARVRIATDSAGEITAALTLKSRRRGFCRHEYERLIDVDLAERLLDAFPANQIIRKRRCYVRYSGSDWTVDFFDGANAGLAIAEIELTHPEQLFELPYWIGAEVTLDTRYGNSALARRPYGLWPARDVRTPECPRIGLAMDRRPISPAGPPG